MSIVKPTKLESAKIFISSPFYKTWQAYCRMRDFTLRIVTRQSTKARKELTQANIVKYIIPSKTFRLWYFTHLCFVYFRQILAQVLPDSFKKYLKRQFLIITSLLGEKIDANIRSEWEAWTDKRSDSSIDYINFGVTTFGYRFQRPQQLAKSLAERGNRVFYIESEFNYSTSLSKCKINVTKELPGVYSVKVSAPTNYFIYQDKLSPQGQKIIFSCLKKVFRKARIINPVAKIDHPFWQPLTNVLSMPIVYDAMDHHQGFQETSKAILVQESQLVQQCDLLVVSSNYLKNKLTSNKNRTLMLKNAGDYTHFGPSKNRLKQPDDLKGLNGPIFGYFGAIASWLDISIIENVAKSFPLASLVFIGRVQNRKIKTLAFKYKNIHLLGEKSYHELPAYLSYFDVCLIPFKLTQLIKATNPVKIYEYFASGKPVVTTAIPELNQFKKLIYTGNSPRQFVAMIKMALAEKSSKLRLLRKQVARNNTWSQRAKSFELAVHERFFPKVSVVILVYNHVNLSRISIDSVLERSKYPKLELLAVDNQSDSETQKMLKSYIGKPNIKVIFNKENYGFAKGNNVGMKKATGDYIVLLNNDVRVTPGWIERLVYHARGKNIGLVGPVTNSIGNESKIDIAYNWDDAVEIESKSADYIYSHWGEFLKLPNIAAFAWLKPRWVYKKLGGLDERFGRGLFEDDDYCVRVKRAKLDILCVEDSFVHHYGGASTNWGSPEFQLLFNTNKAKFESKWNTKWVPHQYRKK